MKNIKLIDFFGFALCNISTPKYMTKPLLLYKYKGKTIFPTGIFTGVSFSEELKAIEKDGYKITLIRRVEFSKTYLFNTYVEHFYNKKKFSYGPERFIAKMHLNQLYGIFDRRNKLIQTINIYKKDLPKYLTTRIIKTIIDINSDIVTLLIKNYINIIKQLNIYFDREYLSKFTNIKNNVVVATAVTS